MSAYRRIGVSAYRRIGVSACRRVGVSACRRVSARAGGALPLHAESFLPRKRSTSGFWKVLIPWHIRSSCLLETGVSQLFNPIA